MVRDPAVHRAVLREVREAAAALDLPIAGLIASPLRGPAGNREFLVELRRDAAPIDDERIDGVVGEGSVAMITVSPSAAS